MPAMDMMDHAAMAHNNHMDMGHEMPGMEMKTDMDMKMDMGEGNTRCGMDMKMYFHFGHMEMAVLFDWWSIHTVWELLLSMLGLCVLSFLYEALKYARDHLFRKSLAGAQYTSSSKNDITITDGAQPVRYMEQIIMPPPMHMMSSGHLVQTLLHMLQFTISYMLMLVFMTYNVWLCLAVLVGSALGYFFFGWRKSVVVDITEHCH